MAGTEKKNLALKKARKERRLSQAALAELVGVNLQSIYKMEAGIIKPSLATGIKISEALGKSLDELFKESLN